ncbi:U-box domain-containing protein 31-like isoform X1 [Cucurbita moschata]|uniref:U-box domain-containing protein n=1 Tax=Cucurbita moschata TaxID=3662 RepID=A0A6J1HFA1_CUCMO|nr:U-box domain-containing protein 31-like isoform X1 [Cucurbita moschata]
MPIYHPSICTQRDPKLLVGCGAHILDLQTVVKDGILGGGGGGVIAADGGAQKLDLKEMIEELESSIEVPSVFICPISLEPMQDPVTLCSGQTYERSNILKWFSLGHLTCPTTMQELWDDSVTPNRTLHQLIHTWFSQKYLALKKRSEDVQGRVLELLDSLKKVKGQARVQSLKDLRHVVTAHSSAKKMVVDNGGVALISSLLGSFTSHAVGSEGVGILVNLDLNSELKKNLIQPTRISLIADILNEGSIETKINCTKFIKMLTEGDASTIENVSSLSLLVGLLRMVKDQRHPNGVTAALALLRTLCSNESIRKQLVGIGAVAKLGGALSGLNAESLESALYILDVLSSLPEGRLALKNCEDTVRNLVKLLMKVSEICTRFALSILWAVFKLAPEECSVLAVEAGLAAKLLLVIQSGFNPELKQRSAELLKLCSLNYPDSIFISKCKLTRTIQ